MTCSPVAPNSSGDCINQQRVNYFYPFVISTAEDKPSTSAIRIVVGGKSVNYTISERISLYGQQRIAQFLTCFFRVSHQIMFLT